MVGATAIVALRSADDDAARLVTRLHQEASTSFRLRLAEHLALSPSLTDAERRDALAALLRSQAIGPDGRAFILDGTGALIASSAPDGDAVVAEAMAGLARHPRPPTTKGAATEFRFDHVSTRPLSRDTWLTYATTLRDDAEGRRWILVSAIPESFYLAGARIGGSRAAMVFALALMLSLLLAAALASIVTAPLRRIARATQTMARGDLSARAPDSRLEELGDLARSFNDMSARLQASFDRLQLAIDAAGLGIWDWDVAQDRLVWDDSMYRLYGVRKEEFGGAFDAWTRCLVPEDRERATGDVEAALRGDREYRIRLQGAARGRRHPRHSRCGADHPQHRGPGRAHRRRQPRRDGPDQRGSRTRAARPRAAPAPGRPRSAGRQPHHRAARRQGRRGERQPGEERVPGQHVARDPHADERHPRLRAAAAARPEPGRGPAAADRHHPLQRQPPADADQRHPGDVEDRGRPGDADDRTLRSACPAARRARDVPGAVREEGPRALVRARSGTCPGRCRGTPARSGRCSSTC